MTPRQTRPTPTAGKLQALNRTQNKNKLWIYKAVKTAALHKCSVSDATTAVVSK